MTNDTKMMLPIEMVEIDPDDLPLTLPILSRIHNNARYTLKLSTEGILFTCVVLIKDNKISKEKERVFTYNMKGILNHFCNSVTLEDH